MDTSWNVVYDTYDTENEALREALCTLGNGYFATRGAHEESKDNGQHYPGTYLAGGYNRLKSEIGDKIIENEDLVNWPNWLLLKFRAEGGEWVDMDNATILEFEQKLNLREGFLERRVIIKDREKRETEIVSKRFVHMKEHHLAGIQWKFTPRNWDGKITIHSALDGSVINNGVARYRDLESRHLKINETGCFEEDGIYIQAETMQSATRMTQAARTKVHSANAHIAVERNTVQKADYIAHELSFNAGKNQLVTVDKTVSVFTSGDKAITDTITEAQNEVLRAKSFEELAEEQSRTFARMWGRVDTKISCNNEEEQLILRLHLFHLFQTASLNTFDVDAGIPSRGWHGEAYRGHILWDELFIFPILNLSFSELSRSLLMYRYRRLNAARYNAKKNGYEGAMYPWQSGSNGREESQEIHLNPQSGRWIPDNTFLQRHVNAAIAYNVWHYYEISDDYEFLSFYGAEMLLEITKFWASKVVWSKEKQKYEIHNVVGPDEYHTEYPESQEPGLNNNAYTNVMVIWLFKHAIKVLDVLDEVRSVEIQEKLNLKKDDIERWDKISRNIFIPFIDEKKKILSQFEGFENLKDLDWNKYHKKYGEILRLDRILESENDNPNNYKAAKQADVLMLFYLFSSDELAELMERSGYDFPAKAIPENINYYQKITSHGSTLSKVVSSWVFARSNREKSWHSFKKALMSDFKDIQGGTTSEGIHLGAMAGTIDLIQRCYTGLEFRDDTIWFNPHLPDALKEIAFKIKYRCTWISVHCTKDHLKLTCSGGKNKKTIPIRVKGKRFTLKSGEEKVLEFGRNKVEAV